MATGHANGIGKHLRRLALSADSGASDGRLLEQFLAKKDEAAFEQLVRRHGPMVWNVCRRMLFNETDAEDAFQATFLVLVRKAGSIVPGQMVGNWLYGVACHTARKARALASRRGATERQVETMPQPEARTRADSDSFELNAILDEELERLPDGYRAAIVLCDLQGRSRREAARQLAIAEGTLSSRLARGRAQLARQLSRRGVFVTAGAMASALAQLDATAAPAVLQQATLHSCPINAMGKTTAGAVSNRVTALTEGVLKTMLLNKLKTVLTITLIAGAAVVGAGMVIFQASAQTASRDSAKTEEQKPAPAAIQAKKKDADLIQGTWNLVAVQDNGREVPKQEFAGSKMVFNKENVIFSIHSDGKLKETHELTIALDPSKNPKWIDITENRKLKEAIYELKGNKLKIVMDEASKRGRPTAFRSEAGSANDLYMIFEREPAKTGKAGASGRGSGEDKNQNPPRAAAQNRKDYRSLEGTWKVITMHDGDNTLHKQEFLWTEMVIANGKITFIARKGGNAKTKELTYTVIPGKREPHWIDMTDKGKTFRGLYQLRPNTLKLVWNKRDGNTRPTALRSGAGRPDNLYTIYTRVPPIKIKRTPPIQPKKAKAPVPNARRFQLEMPIAFNLQSKPVNQANRFSIVHVGEGTFHLGQDARLTAKLRVRVAQYAKVEYRIYAAVFDAKGSVLGTASHKEEVRYLRLGRMPTRFATIDMDFGVSEAFQRAAYVVVSISEPKVPPPG